MSITVVDTHLRLSRHHREDSTYPHINIRSHRSVFGMYECFFFGSLVVSTSPTSVEKIVKGIIDRMRELGLYVDEYKPIG